MSFNDQSQREAAAAAQALAFEAQHSKSAQIRGRVRARLLQAKNAAKATGSKIAAQAAHEQTPVERVREQYAAEIEAAREQAILDQEKNLVEQRIREQYASNPPRPRPQGGPIRRGFSYVSKNANLKPLGSASSSTLAPRVPQFRTRGSFNLSAGFSAPRKSPVAGFGSSVRINPWRGSGQRILRKVPSKRVIVSRPKKKSVVAF